MKKVMIIGSGGAGKSTAAMALHNISGLPIFHLDSYYWKPGWNPTPKAEWEEIITELGKKPEWIMDRNYGGKMDIRLAVAYTIIFFHFPRLVCLTSALKRRYFGPRLDIIPGCPEQIDWEFLSWIWNYNKTSASGILKKLDGFKNKDT